MTRPVSLIATFTAREGDQERVRTMILELRDSVRGVEGNTQFEVHRLQERPREFLVYESYVSKESFDYHLASEANTRFNDQLGDLIEEQESQLMWLSEP
jgi:quinol monooxygenase YgiN